MPEIKTILYATDLGKHTRPVFRQAVALARKCGARIVMLHVVEPIGATGRAVLSLYLPKKNAADFEKESRQELLARMKERLARFCEEEAGMCGGDSALVSDLIVVSGRAGDEIPSQAKAAGADLVVIGSCSEGISGGMLGSTARRVTQDSGIAVLIVPNCQ